MNIEQRVNNWLQEITTTERLSASIEAIYIGLFESDPDYQIYMLGSSEYEDEDDDWACNEDFEPQQKYLGSQIKTEEMEWKTLLNEVIDIVKRHMQNHSNSILNKVKHVAVGFDDGDLVRIR